MTGEVCSEVQPKGTHSQDGASASKCSVEAAAPRSRLKAAEVILHRNPYEHFDSDKCRTALEFFVQGALRAFFTIF